MRMRAARFKRSSRALLLAGLIFVIQASPSSAYVLNAGYWPGGSIWQVDVQYKWGSNLGGSSLWRTAMEDARDDWNSKSIRPEWVYNSSANVTFNTYWADDGNYGKAQWVLNGDNSFNWCNALGNTYTGQSTTAHQRRSTSGHEQGHCLGLGHSAASASIMKTGRDRDDIYTPQSDDVAGINAKYDCPGC